ERYRHFRMRAYAKTLAHHEPLVEAAISKEIMLGAAHLARHVDSDSCHREEVEQQDDPVQGRDPYLFQRRFPHALSDDRAIGPLSDWSIESLLCPPVM